MPLFMVQAAYASEAWATQLQNPQNRVEQVRPMIEANGGSCLPSTTPLGSMMWSPSSRHQTM